MQKRKGNILLSGVLTAAVLFLAISAPFTFINESGSNIIYNFKDFILSFSLIFGTAIILLFFSLKGQNKIFNPKYTVLFYLLFAFADNNAILFSNLLIVAPLLIFAQFFFLKKEIYITSLILGVCAILYPSLLLIAPLAILVYSLFRPEPLKSVAISIGGFLTPFLYLYAYKFITNENLIDYSYSLIKSIIVLKPIYNNLDLLSGAMLVMEAILSFWILYYGLVRLGRCDNLSRVLILTQIIAIIFFIVLALFSFGGADMPLNLILAVPAALLSANFISYINRRLHSLLIILFVITLIVVRLSKLFNLFNFGA